MATITGLTAARMLQIEAESINNATKVGDNLILIRHDGTQINLGSIKGNTGAQGPKGDPGSGWVATEIGDLSNLDTFVTPGVNIQSQTAEALNGQNYPVAEAGRLEVYANAEASLVWQTYHSVSNRLFVRVRVSGSWIPWNELGGNGVVSSTNYGNISSGTGTVNGGYEKKANGRLTCFIRCAIQPTANAFSSRTWTFPVPFVATPLTQVTASSGATTVDNAQESAPTLTKVDIGIVRSNTAHTYINAIAEGFWK